MAACVAGVLRHHDDCVWPPNLLLQAWRELYALGCAAQATAEYHLARREASLRTVDRGLVMGGSALRTLLHEAAQALHEELAMACMSDTIATGTLGAEPRHPVPLPPQSCCTPPGEPIPRLHRPSLDVFVRQCLAPAKPTVLTGVRCCFHASCTWPYLIVIQPQAAWSTGLHCSAGVTQPTGHGLLVRALCLWRLGRTIWPMAGARVCCHWSRC